MKRYQKPVIIISALIVLAVFSACAGPKPASQPAVAPAESSSAAASSSSTPVASSSAPAELESTSSESPASSTVSSKAVSDNMLLNQTVVELPVKNGSGTDTIGTYGYIQFDKELMKEMITEDNFIEFYEAVIKDKGYNYFAISFGDDTGVFFPAGGYLIVNYGTIDENRLLTETLGNIIFDGEHYTYEPKES